MTYADLIERALKEVTDAGSSLSALLLAVDALNKSVPTLEELNEAFFELQRRGHFPSRDWSPVTREAYEQAMSASHEWMAQMLEKQGIPREQQERNLATQECDALLMALRATHRVPNCER